MVLAQVRFHVDDDGACTVQHVKTCRWDGKIQSRRGRICFSGRVLMMKQGKTKQVCRFPSEKTNGDNWMSGSMYVGMQ